VTALDELLELELMVLRGVKYIFELKIEVFALAHTSLVAAPITAGMVDLTAALRPHICTNAFPAVAIIDMMYV